MKVHERVNVDKVKRYSPSVGELAGSKAGESTPCRCLSPTTARGSMRWRAILGKKEELEDASSSAVDDPHLHHRDP